jgi:hypothetical protein
LFGFNLIQGEDLDRVEEYQNQNTMSTSNPTGNQYGALRLVYDHFNQELFEGQLADCMLTFTRKRNTHGFLAPYRWSTHDSQEFAIHEISLSVYTIGRPLIEVLSTLVHEMAHLWQFDFGTPSRGGYHNKEWANKMEELGLMPSANGKPSGKRTGQNMTHYIIPDGAYVQAFKAMPPEYLIPFTSIESFLTNKQEQEPNEPQGMGERGAPSGGARSSSSRKKTKYLCSCNYSVYGKPGLTMTCNVCSEQLQEQ